MIHLDTPFLVDLLRERRQGSEGPAGKLLQDRLADEELAISVHVACELYAGAELASNRSRERRRVEALCGSLHLVYPDDAFAPTGRLLADLRRAGQPIATLDLLIATAAVRNEAPLAELAPRGALGTGALPDAFDPTGAQTHPGTGQVAEAHPAGRPPDPYGYDEKRRKKALEEAEDTLTVAESAVLDGGWGYLRVHTFLWKSPRKTWQAIEGALEPLVDQAGLILDLRDNHGGFVESAIRTVEHFVKDKTLIARLQARSPGSDYYAAGFWDPKRGVHAAPPVLAEPRKPVYEGPLVVLIDAGCFSACELVAGGLRDIQRARLVGTGRTGGGSGTVTGYELPSGAVINFSLFVLWRPDGRQIDFEGINPDVKVTERPADWAAGRDRVLEKAIELLEAGEAPTLADMVVIEEDS